MKTRYKIIIIVCLSFIPISIFFPQVFLIFHLDKYETNENCDILNGTWDWIDDKCVEMEYDTHNVKNMCVDLGGKKSCDTRCEGSWKWNYWNIGFRSMCFSVCRDACEFTKVFPDNAQLIPEPNIEGFDIPPILMTSVKFEDHEIINSITPEVAKYLGENYKILVSIQYDDTGDGLKIKHRFETDDGKNIVTVTIHNGKVINIDKYEKRHWGGPPTINYTK